MRTAHYLKMKRIGLFSYAWAMLLFLLVCPSIWAGGTGAEKDDTILMFVGEDTPVVTVASRGPESPAAAPAIATVVDRRTIEEKGYQTLGELLDAEVGFYMAPRARGTVPYLRGIPEGILFLYDGVPVTMDVTKQLHPLDRELSLKGVERVEIIRGPASVLWGPDAYAGVVNVVPMRGRDNPGVKTGVFAGSNELKGGYLNWGARGNHWDAFLSGYGAGETYFDDTYTVSKPIGQAGSDGAAEGHVGPSRYRELTGNFQAGDWLSVSGRFSDFERRYTLHDPGTLSWGGERQSPISYLKTTLTKTIGPSHWTLSGYYQDIRYQVTNVDLKREQRNRIYSGELLWDRRLWGKGLLTAGLSYRKNNVEGALVRDGFLPDFLKPGNTIFVPEVQQADYNNTLKSAFFQYLHTWRNLGWWAGGRIDDHSQYPSTFSYSLGVNWSFSRELRFKAAYGTAYRSPYSGQLFGGTSFDPEGISTFNLQAAWNPSAGKSLTVTGFSSRLTDHIQESPYGGLSIPSDQRVQGLEFEGRFGLTDALDLSSALTVLDDGGGHVSYRTLKYTFVRPDGTRENVYDAWGEPFYVGADVIGRLGLTYRFRSDASVALDVTKTSKVPYSFTEDTICGKYDQPLLLGLTFRLKDLLLKNSTLTLRGKNLLDGDYRVPGVYGPVEGEPFSLYVEWSVGF